jgi:hypothetical protein
MSPMIPMNMSGWTNYVHVDAGATVKIVNGQAEVDFKNEGNETWSVLLQKLEFDLEARKTYTVTFMASSDVPRKVEVVIDDAKYTRATSAIIEINETLTQYSFDFKMTEPKTVNYKILMGLMLDESTIGAHKVVVTDAQVYEK